MTVEFIGESKMQWTNLSKKEKEILKANGLTAIDGKLVADMEQPDKAREFIAKLRDAADTAEKQSMAATRSKANRLAQNARAARKDADRIEKSLGE